MDRRSPDRRTFRIYLCGRMSLECGDRLVGESGLAGRQGRRLLAFLGTRRQHPTSRADAIDAVWGPDPPPAVDVALDALVSKLRTALRSAGGSTAAGIITDSGSYQLAAPGAWIDIEAARTSLDAAEGALRRSDPKRAWAPANVAATIARQPFLVEEESAWVIRERAVLSRVFRRALIVLSHVSTSNGEYELGIQHASEALSAEPFDEVACQTLMQAHAAAGNRAEALRVYAECRRVFREELGAEPSPQTERVFLKILRSGQRES